MDRGHQVAMLVFDNVDCVADPASEHVHSYFLGVRSPSATNHRGDAPGKRWTVAQLLRNPGNLRGDGLFKGGRRRSRFRLWPLCRREHGRLARPQPATARRRILDRRVAGMPCKARVVAFRVRHTLRRAATLWGWHSNSAICIARGARPAPPGRPAPAPRLHPAASAPPLLLLPRSCSGCRSCRICCRICRHQGLALPLHKLGTLEIRLHSVALQLGSSRVLFPFLLLAGDLAGVGLGRWGCCALLRRGCADGRTGICTPVGAPPECPRDGPVAGNTRNSECV